MNKIKLMEDYNQKMKSLAHGYMVEIDKIGQAEWSEILSRFDDATIYQTWSYGSVRWGEANLSHLVLRKDGEIIAASQLRIIKIPVVGSGIANVKWGPMWQRRGRQKYPEHFRKILLALIEEYGLRRGLLLRIIPNQVRDNTEMIYSILQSEGFKWIPSIVSYKTLIIDLSPSLDELRRDLKKKWRQHLGRAERNMSLKVIDGVSDDLFELVIHLYNQMHYRKKFGDTLILGDLRAIQKDLPDDLKMKIMICELKGEPIAARVVSLMGDVAVDFIAATGNKGLDSYSSYLLQWRMVEWLKSSGCRWYDLGGIDPDKNPGGYQFKSGLVGKNGRQVIFGEFDVCQSLLSSFLVKIGDQLTAICGERKHVLGKISNIFK